MRSQRYQQGLGLLTKASRKRKAGLMQRDITKPLNAVVDLVPASAAKVA